MRNLALRSVAALLLLLCADTRHLDAWTHGNGGVVGTVISPLYIGGGGYSTGFDMASDGTMLTRVDIYGAYAANTVVGTVWKQMVTQSAMPSVYTSTATPYLNGGAWEVRIDPSNSNNFWMMYCAQSGEPLTTLLKSTNKGGTWTTTGFPFFAGDANIGNVSRYASGQRIAVDPANSNIIWASTNTDLYVSQDGGITFNQVDGGSSGLPAAIGTIGFVGMQFDPTSGTTSGGTNRMLVGNSGNGVYVSSNAYLGTSSTWTKITSSVTNPGHAKMATDGNYYFNTQTATTSLYRVDTSNNLTSTTPSSNGIANFAVDPNNPARLATLQFGQLVFGGPVNGSPSWSTRNTVYTVTASDAPWQVNGGSPPSDGEVYFDPFVTASATSITIGTGSRGPFTVAAGLNIVNGDLMRITNTGTPTNYMLGTATYSGTSLTITVLGANPGGYLGNATGGAGTFAAWTITKERLWISSGFGNFWTDGLYNSGTAYTWNSMNIGIDDLVARSVIWPTSGNPVLVAADIPTWAVPTNPVNATTGLLGFGPTSPFTLREGAAADWASNNPSLIVLATGTSASTLFTGTNNSGGANGSWTAFATNPPSNTGTAIAATDTNNILIANPTAISFTINGGSAWAAVTGASIPSSGWSQGLASNPNNQPICADRVTNGTFYGYNVAGNVYKIVSGTATKQFTGSLDPSGGAFNYQLKCVPSNGGDLFFTAGSASDAFGLYSSGLAGVLAFVPSAATYPFRFSHDGGITWTSLTGVANALSMGFTAHAPGQTYPAIVIAGWVSGVYGIWRCDNFNPASPASSCTWNNVGTFARGTIDLPTSIEGDPSQWGRFIIGHNGTGFAIGQMVGASSIWPFLLKRDLDPTANDNTPMWLNAVA